MEKSSAPDLGVIDSSPDFRFTPMEKSSPADLADNDSPPGFRFTPTDVELILYYLKRKICRRKFNDKMIADIDVYKHEPEDLPNLSNGKGRDFYFFNPVAKKYAVGSRVNRATERGYWKTTGKDRTILYNSRIVGNKRTLVYYRGRAPHGDRTDWVIHEYKLDGDELKGLHNAQDDYVICKLFNKSGIGSRNDALTYGESFREEDLNDDDSKVSDMGNQSSIASLPDTYLPFFDKEEGWIDDFTKMSDMGNQGSISSLATGSSQAGCESSVISEPFVHWPGLFELPPYLSDSPQMLLSEGIGSEERSLQKRPRLQRSRRWSILASALKAVMILRIPLRRKSRIRLLEKKPELWDSRGWNVLALVIGFVTRMRKLVREKYRIQMMLYCCLFDDDQEFEKEKLVQLWIAAGFLYKEPFEDNGNRFFDYLLGKEYILPSRVDILTQTRMYKVNLNKLTANLAHISTIKDFQLKLEDGNMRANKSADSWHISVSRRNIDQATLDALKKFSDLKTLLFLDGSLMKLVSSDVFLALKSLRALDLSGSQITELPSCIGDVRELCYLDVSWTLIKRLPRSIVRLRKLQTLKLKGCEHLSVLPKGMNELINLRHLEYDVLGQLSSMPRGIGALVKLQTLPAFIVDDEDGCNIRELKNMNKLSGRFCIAGLENVASSEDAKEASLSTKEHLKQLELRWSDISEFHENEDQNYNEVLEYLEPNSCIEELQIICFPGSLLPSWITNLQYGNLISMSLFNCENCLDLPSLGQLPKLKNLEIIQMNNVRIIELGDDMSDDAFQALETLAIDGMFSLETWTGLGCGTCPSLVRFTVKRCPHLRALYSFPHFGFLEHLEVTHCRLLEYLPEELLSAPLANLIVDSCPLLEKRYCEGGEDSSKVKHVSNIWIDGTETESSDENGVEDTYP